MATAVKKAKAPATSGIQVPVAELSHEEVRVATVTVPNEGFEGYRRQVRFIDGQARLPEPKAEDFMNSEDFEREHANWKEILDYLAREYKYHVEFSTQIVRSESAESED